MKTDIRKNIKLSNFSTFKIGGDARYFCEVNDENELIVAIKFARKNKLNFFVIGNGSNILIKDEGFNGLVIKMSMKGIKIESKNENFSIVSVFAGESFDDLILFAIKNDLSGIENLWNIPGTVGAAAVQNIGAYGVEAGDFIESVECIDVKTFEKYIIKNKKCNFEYRDSVFKSNKNLIITKVNFKLNNYFVPNVEYSSLKDIFNCPTNSKDKKNSDAKEIIKVIEEIRKNKLPDWKVLGTAGSFFKNPIITIKKYNLLFKKYPNLPKYEAGQGYAKIPLGFVIDKICELKGCREGKVGLYEKQSLVVVNYGGATFSEIDSFAKKIEEMVYKKVQIRIDREVETV